MMLLDIVDFKFHLMPWWHQQCLTLGPRSHSLSSHTVAGAKTFQIEREMASMQASLATRQPPLKSCLLAGKGKPSSCSTTMTSIAPLSVAGLIEFQVFDTEPPRLLTYCISMSKVHNHLVWANGAQRLKVVTRTLLTSKFIIKSHRKPRGYVSSKSY